jgi:AAA+ superfamily predicted ATPase
MPDEADSNKPQPKLVSDQDRLDQLILNARHPCVWIVTNEESRALQMTTDTAMAAREPLWVWSAVKGLRPGLIEHGRPVANTEHPAAALFHLCTSNETPCIAVMIDLAGHLDDARTLRALRDVLFEFRSNGSCVVLIDHEDKLPAVIVAEATKLELSFPNEAELERLIRNTLRKVSERRQVEAKLSRRDLQTIIRNLRGLTRRQAEQIIIDAVCEDQRFDADDINTVLAHKRRRLQQDGVLEFIEAPVDLNEIGGLNRLKAWLRHRAEALSDDAAQFGLTAPRGVLLLGVQGAGKSLSAKAIATAWQRPLLRLDPGALYDRYIGESERRLRETLHQAEMMSPIILWIDEIEKGFASAASHSVDGGLSQRMFGTLLTWMQEHEAPVFLVATANNIDALPPELLRKGRFDEIFFVDLPLPGVREEIFAIHLRRRKRDPMHFDLAALARNSEGFSGAEIEQAVIAALHEAFSSKSELTTDLILAALRRSPPLSVTAAERVAALREWARERCVPAD